MSNNYQQYLTTDAIGGATLKHFPGTTLTITEDDLFALDIEYAPQLKRLVIQRLKPGKTPHIRLLDTPELECIELADSLEPVIIHCAIANSPLYKLSINGKIEAIDALFDRFGLTQQAYPHHAYWNGFIMTNPDAIPALNCQQHLIAVKGESNYSIDNLQLNGNNDWIVHKTLGVRQLTVATKGKILVEEFPLLSINMLSKEADLTIINTPMLQRINGEGRQLKVNLEKHSVGEMHVLGRWSQLILKAPSLAKLSAKQIQKLVITDAHQLENVELSLNIPVDCHGSLPVALSQSARFFFHESTVRQLLLEIKEGRTELLPSLLTVLPLAGYRNQVRHSLSALKELCDMGMPADLIWKARTELLLNNLRYYEKNLYNDLKQSSVHAPWCWSLSPDLRQETLLLDLMIWDHCQKTVEDAQKYVQTLTRQANRVQSLPVLFQCLTSKRTTQSLYNLVVKQIYSYSLYIPEIQRLRDVFDQEMLSKRLLYAIENATDKGARKTLIKSLMNLLTYNAFMEEIPKLLVSDPITVRADLIRISNAANGWYNGFFNINITHRQSKLDMIEDARNKLLMMVLCPFSQPTSKHSMENTYE